MPKKLGETETIVKYYSLSNASSKGSTWATWNVALSGYEVVYAGINSIIVGNGTAQGTYQTTSVSRSDNSVTMQLSSAQYSWNIYDCTLAVVYKAV